MNNKKRFFIVLYSFLIIFLANKTNKKETYHYEVNSNFKYGEMIPYGSYSNGNVYIVFDETMKSIVITNDNDVYVIDQRYLNNSNMEIYNSYKIKTRKEMYEILRLLLEYEKDFPSDWKRTIESMLNEWRAHNISYSIGYRTESSQMVDLDNKDESKYIFNMK